MSDRTSSSDNEWLEKLYAEGHIKKKPKKKKVEAPSIFPDLFWVWQAFCTLSEQRGIGPNGPVPITLSDMKAYAELSGRCEERYREQLLRFIPPLDRVYLADFYEKQRIEFEKQQKKAARGR